MIVRKSVFNRFLRRLSLSDKFRVEDLEVEVTRSEEAGAEVVSPESVRGSSDREASEASENRSIEESVDREVSKL